MAPTAGCRTAYVDPRTCLICAIIRDITADKATHVALRDAELRAAALQKASEDHAHLLAVLASSGAMLWRMDRHGIFTLFEGARTSPVGIQASDYLGRSILDVSRNAGVIRAVRHCLEHGEPWVTMGQINGHAMELHLTPQRDADGAVDGLVGVAIDATGRMRAEDAVQQGRRLLRAVFTHVASGIVITSLDGRWLRVNPAVEQLLGYKV